MSYFTTLLYEKGLQKHDGRPLWKYMLNDDAYEALLQKLRFSNSITVDPKDVTLYYAEWWKRNYSGGKPSSEEIFASLDGNLNTMLSYKEFYKLAKQGGQILGLKWLTKQNTLYFRTLLLQGGLPLSHIAANQGKYQDFLLAVLDQQPDTIEDFMFNPDVIGFLPKSSQNDIIYENCFEIVKSILEGENLYDDLLESSEMLRDISSTLKVRKAELVQTQRISKPKNFWTLSFLEGRISINLRIGLADKYEAQSLSSILGFEVTERVYQLYLNDTLLCKFRKMVNGKYITDWYLHGNHEWNEEDILPYAYVFVDGIRYEVKDFVQTIPNLDGPSLWSKCSENEWRLIKGNSSPDKEAALLFPNKWNSNQLPIELTILGQQLSWLCFEGEIEISLNNKIQRYLSGIKSFDWTIVSEKPHWMCKASMPVVQKRLQVNVYDETNKKVSADEYKLWIRNHNSEDHWKVVSDIKQLPLGCIDLKIESKGLVAHDTFFSIGNVHAEYGDRTINYAELKIQNSSNFEFKLDESSILDIECTADKYVLRVKTEYSRIPSCVRGTVGNRSQRKLYFEIESPFRGMAITNKYGVIMSQKEPLSLATLYGLRILSASNNETIVKIKNRIKAEVIITKEIKESSQPVISFRDEIVKLFYLADAMDHRNHVTLELCVGRESVSYDISGFSSMLNIDLQLESQVSLSENDEELDLYAIPLNCLSEHIALIPLLKEFAAFKIPETEVSKQFIVVSSKVNGKQVMPRFVNTDENYQGFEKTDRIERYHTALLEQKFEHEIWKQLLSYFNICIENDLPFSTFDQLRAISRSSRVAARAFLFLGINQYAPEAYIQKSIPEMEMDLGICFHWIKKDDWWYALNEMDELYQNRYFEGIYSLISSYMHENGLSELLQFISGERNIVSRIYNVDIYQLRAQLGERILRGLPSRSPRITKNYNIQILEHMEVHLLLHAPIAVAESINDIQHEYPIWAGDDFRDTLRRNIQYSQYVNPAFYKKVILHALNNN